MEPGFGAVAGFNGLFGLRGKKGRPPKEGVASEGLEGRIMVKNHGVTN